MSDTGYLPDHTSQSIDGHDVFVNVVEFGDVSAGEWWYVASVDRWPFVPSTDNNTYRVSYASYPCAAKEFGGSERAIVLSYAGDSDDPIFQSVDWYSRGHRHRDSGPAIIKTDGSVEWWINGRLVLGVDDWIIDNGLPPWQDWTDDDRVHFKLRFG